MKEITWEIVTEPQPPVCGAKRSPRSIITCEIEKGHKNGFHAGRGKLGNWFTWND